MAFTIASPTFFPPPLLHKGLPNSLSAFPAHSHSPFFILPESRRSSHLGGGFGAPRVWRARPVASLGGLIGGLFKGADTGESTRQQYQPTVTSINALEAEMSLLSDSQLRQRTSSLKERAAARESLDALLPVSLIIIILIIITTVNQRLAYLLFHD